MEVNTYFFDTYALHEIVEGNPNYALFSKNVGIITTKLNLMEFYYSLLTEHDDEEVAEFYYQHYSKFAIEADDGLIKAAMKFRKEIKSKNKKSNISYVDAVGYMAARQRNIRFLTGDKEFRMLDNVEFVK